VLDQAVALDPPLDVDDDGNVDAEIVRARPSTPQAITSDGEDVFVLFTNILRSATPTTPMQLWPGVLGHVRIVDNTPIWQSLVQLPCDNPSSLDVATDVIWISCSGRLGFSGGRTEQVGDGALVVVPRSGARLGVAQRRVQARHAFGPLLFDNNRVVVGDLLDGTLRRYSSAGALQDEHVVQSGVSSLFSTIMVGGQLWVGGFAPAEVIIDPFGSSKRVRLDSAAAPRGLVAMTPRAAGGSWALLTLSSELVVVTTDQEQP
jgi:hypothetical protein